MKVYNIKYGEDSFGLLGVHAASIFDGEEEENKMDKAVKEASLVSFRAGWEDYEYFMLGVIDILGAKGYFCEVVEVETIYIIN